MTRKFSLKESVIDISAPICSAFWRPRRARGGSIHHRVTRVVFYTLVLRRHEGRREGWKANSRSLSHWTCGKGDKSRNSQPHALDRPLALLLPYVWSLSLTQLIFYASHAAHVKPRQLRVRPPHPRPSVRRVASSRSCSSCSFSRRARDGRTDGRRERVSHDAEKEDPRGENTPSLLTSVRVH